MAHSKSKESKTQPATATTTKLQKSNQKMTQWKWGEHCQPNMHIPQHLTYANEWFISNNLIVIFYRLHVIHSYHLFLLFCIKKLPCIYKAWVSSSSSTDKLIFRFICAKCGWCWGTILILSALFLSIHRQNFKLTMVSYSLFIFAWIVFLNDKCVAG